MINLPDEINWESVISCIEEGKCLPIINYDVSNDFLMEYAAIIKAWAENVGYPLADHSNLARIAQFVSVDKGGDLIAKKRFLDFLKKSLLDRYENESSLDIYKKTLPGDLKHFLKTLEAELSHLSLSGLISRLGFPNFEEVQTNPLRILAELPLPIYLTTNYSELLEVALRAAKKDPQTQICRWRDGLEHEVPSIFDTDYWPSENKPLVYHLHGLDAHPYSLVLTEDDYLDFLINISQDRKLIPPPVNEALGDWSILLLGYQLHNWDFRTVFKGLIAQKRNTRGSELNLSIQVDPEAELTNITKARAYLERYFGKVNFSVYWGNAQSFTQELQVKWKEYHDR